MKPNVTYDMCHDCMKNLDRGSCTQCRFWHRLLMTTASAHGFEGGGLNPGGGYLCFPVGDCQLSGYNQEYDFYQLLAFIAAHGLKAGAIAPLPTPRSINFPMRTDAIVTMTNVPYDLRVSEVERFVEFIRALETVDTRKEPHAPR